MTSVPAFFFRENVNGVWGSLGPALIPSGRGKDSQHYALVGEGHFELQAVTSLKFDKRPVPTDAFSVAASGESHGFCKHLTSLACIIGLKLTSVFLCL